MPEEYEFHPAADLFPLMDVDGAEFGELVADIREHGLLEPIELYEDQVLDGRNRLRACQHAGVRPCFREWNGESPVNYVVSRNLHRRHLSDDQRGAIASRMLPMLEAEGRRRREANLKRGSELPEVADSPHRGRARDRAAQQLKVSPHKVRQAAALGAEAPELFEAVERGELKLAEAERRAAEAMGEAHRENERPPDVGGPLVEAQKVLHRAYRQVVELPRYDHRNLVAGLNDGERTELAQAVPKLWAWLGRVEGELAAYQASPREIDHDGRDGEVATHE